VRWLPIVWLSILRTTETAFYRVVASLFARLPDFVPERVVDAMEEKTEVLPVPLLPVVEAQASAWRPEEKSRALRILWNARFEHDKGGEGTSSYSQGPGTVRAPLSARCYRATVSQFTRGVFLQSNGIFEHRLVQFGYMDSAADYHALQAGADIILSTALHEFQGLAVMQAVRAGCMPLVPDRLAYREMYPEHCRYQSCPDNLQQEADSAITLLLELAARPSVPIDMSAYSIEQLRPRYLRLLQSLQDSQPQPS